MTFASRSADCGVCWSSMRFMIVEWPDESIAAPGRPLVAAVGRRVPPGRTICGNRRVDDALLPEVALVSGVFADVPSVAPEAVVPRQQSGFCPARDVQLREERRGEVVDRLQGELEPGRDGWVG